MPRPVRPRLLLATVAVLAATASGCGDSKTWFDKDPGQPPVSATKGWAKVTPIKVDLPTEDPVHEGAEVPDNSIPIVVNIWAGWCEPCKHELPLLEKVERSGRLHVIGFARDRDSADTAAAMKAAGVTYPNWMDSDASLIVALDRRVPFAVVPSSVLIRDGKVVAVHIGDFKTEAEILEALELT